MSGLQISRVDVHDDAAMTAYWELQRVAMTHDLGRHATYWQLDELFVILRASLKHVDTELYAASLSGELVAIARLDLPLLDNLTMADIAVMVAPRHRRAGHGSALLAAVEASAREHGRSRFIGMCTWAMAGAPDGHDVEAACLGFAARHGYAVGIGDVQRELALPVDDAVLAELAAEAEGHTDGYDVRAWRGAYPEELLESYVGLSSQLMTEAPMGDMEWEQETTDLEAARCQERVQQAAGRTMFRAAAIAPDGTVVAYSDLAYAEHDPSWVYQWGTLVAPAHRGHRLGLAVKIANLRLLQRDERAAGRRLVTWNAEENDHMIGINRRLGFEPTCRGVELVKKL